MARSLSFVFLAASLGLAGHACSSSAGSSGGGGSSGGNPSACPTRAGAGACGPDAGVTCNYGGPCALTTCTCDPTGAWNCGFSSDCTPPPCPAAVPSGACSEDALGQVCSYQDVSGCGPSCTCANEGAGGAWACEAGKSCDAGDAGFEGD